MFKCERPTRVLVLVPCYICTYVHFVLKPDRKSEGEW